ncbi:hypothetical protein [Planctobacterium marinum]|uniref:Uncharacterized protein n=1 Tax=Planctobacterium marinum TaxID=1631968 RepID=A0AA48HID3_9ALTE|nr:hypothetical protein MACH26_29840 [Planctobacterium marinum]
MFAWLWNLWGHKEASEPTVQRASIYKPLPKYYMFNETGNIMLCTSEKNISGFDEDIKNSFIDVTVFFSALSKALHTTNNPITKKSYSLYNYKAVKDILSSSGMFFEVNVEEGVFSSEKAGESLGKEFLQHALNRHFGDVHLPFSRAMFNGMRYQQNLGKKANVSADSDDALSFRGGSIFFICEILMGIPQTTAVLLSIEPVSAKSEDAIKKGKSETVSMFDLGASQESELTAHGIKRRWTFKKRSYLFTPPKFLANNSAYLTRGDCTELDELVDKFRESLPQKGVS